MMDADFLSQQEKAEADAAATRETLATVCSAQIVVANWRSRRHVDIAACRITDEEASQREAEIVLRLVEAWLDLAG